MGKVYGYLLTFRSSGIPTPTSGCSCLISMSGKSRIFIHHIQALMITAALGNFTKELKTGIPINSLANYPHQNNDH